MYSIQNNDSILIKLQKADGIIISGGEDVYSGLYGKEFDTLRCGIFDRRRDALEYTLIHYAVSNKIPLLGVCRGHQILNVSLGGTLIIDIPDDAGSEFLHRDVRKSEKNESTSVFHKVFIKKGTCLYSMVKVDSGLVYSNHHQALEKIANGYMASSYASDKVVESFEPSDTTLQPFILGVQWHPEAMDVSDPLSGTIGRKFIMEVFKHNLID